MKSLVAFTLLLVLLMGCSPAADVDDSSPSIVGSWRLESWTVANDTPRCAEEEGGASGQIMYSRDGHMSAQLGCAGLSMGEPGSMTSGEAIARMTRRHFGYYGTYALDEAAQTVTHHVMGSTAETWVGRDLVRSFVFEGPDRLVLTPAESEGRLVWLRN